jgi:hypothetical protein
MSIRDPGKGRETLPRGREKEREGKGEGRVYMYIVYMERWIEL